ncbi:hypothetical protein QUF75_08615 [Desulfococcaceae bacterium HSG7]|nr:hypothetical protein [Desulfococcaceae bacterium HSG7]
MKLQKYHIHNVLKAYSQQLARREKNGYLPESEPNALCLSPRQKRLVIIRKVTDNIAAKMKQLGDKQPGVSYQSKNQAKTWSDTAYLNSHAPVRFVYNTIDDQNRKLMHTLLIDDSTFLIKSG